MDRAKEISENLARAVIEYDVDGAAKAANEAIRAGVEPIVAIEDGLAKGLQVISDKFQSGEIFISELVIAAEAMKAGLAVLQPELSRRKEQRTKIVGKVVLGTVAGDIHSIGKNIVGSLLFVAGFDVQDVGEDVPAEKFVQFVREVNPDILGLSALMTTTMPAQREVVEALEKDGLRDRVKVIVGGACTSKEWADAMGADGWAPSAVDGVKKAKELVEG